MKAKKSQSAGGVIMQERTSDQENQEKVSDNEDLEICAMDIISAISKKDVKLLAEALQAAFECMENKPHTEESNDFQSMNIKAGGDQYD